jgi:hypothetical protein
MAATTAFQIRVVVEVVVVIIVVALVIPAGVEVLVLSLFDMRQEHLQLRAAPLPQVVDIPFTRLQRLVGLK